MGLTASPRYKYVVAGMAFFSVLGAIGLGRFGYGAILPSMQGGLGLTAAQAGSLASWNLAGYTIMAVVGGILASRFGARGVITLGVGVTALGMLLTGFSSSLASASAARFLTGLGNGMVLPPSIALMGAWFHARRLGVASGVVPAGSSFAIVLVGPTLPLVMGTGGEGWRLGWYVMAATAGVLCVISFVVLRNRPSERPPSERPVASPLRPPMWPIFRSRYAWHLGSIYLIYGIAFMIYFTFFQKRLIGDLGFSSEIAGALFLLLGVGGTLSGVIWGAISDRVGRGRAMAATCILNAAAAMAFALWPHVVVLALSGFLLGLGALSMPSLIGASCGDEFGPVLASASLGFVTIFIGVGQAVGPYIGGLLGDLFSSFVPSYLLSAGVFFLGAVVALLLRDARECRRIAEPTLRVSSASQPIEGAGER